MAYRVNGVTIGFQGINLNCGRYCLEALMLWRHGSKFGKVSQNAIYSVPNLRFEAQYAANARAAHSAAVQAHINERFKIAFDPADHMADYGLKDVPKPAGGPAWEAMLRAYGPIIVGGNIGAVRILCGYGAHFVLVVGVNAGGEVEYYDPLRLDYKLGFGPTGTAIASFEGLADTPVYIARAG